MEENMDGVVFDDMSVEQLQEIIIKHVKEIRRLNNEKKDFVAGVKDVVKELNARVSSAISVLDSKKLKSG